MKRFCIKVLLFALFILAVDRSFVLFKYKIVNVFAEMSVKKLTKVRKYIDSTSIKEIDVAIYGASHPQFAISPETINKLTGKTCFNFAYGGGTNISAQLEFIKKLNIKTKTLIWGIDVYSVREKSAKTDPFQRAFFSKSDSTRFYEQEPGPNESDFANLSTYFLRYSNIYMYSHFIPKFIGDLKQGNYILPNLRKTHTYDLSYFSQYNGYEVTSLGWVKGDGYANTKAYRYPWWVFTVDRESEKALVDMINYCKENGTRLYLVQIPEHKLALSYKQKYIEFDKWVRKFAADKQVTYLDFNRRDVFPVDNDSLFYDTDHLNMRGAELFSEQLANKLKAEGL